MPLKAHHKHNFYIFFSLLLRFLLLALNLELRLNMQAMFFFFVFYREHDIALVITGILFCNLCVFPASEISPIWLPTLFLAAIILSIRPINWTSELCFHSLLIGFRWGRSGSTYRNWYFLCLKRELWWINLHTGIPSINKRFLASNVFAQTKRSALVHL